VQAIAAASRRAAELTRQLLAFGRRQTMIPSVIDLNATITELIPLAIEDSGVAFEIAAQLSPDLPPIRADRIQIITALSKLTANAARSMADGGSIAIATDAATVDSQMQKGRPWLPDGSFVRVRVTDTGPLVDEHTLARLFDPLANEGAERGASLTLSSVYGIVKQSGGYIWAERGETCGTRIVMLFPPTQETVRAQPLGVVAQQACNRVLLVEDDEAVREFLVESLLHHGFSVRMAGTAEEALQQWTSAEFDLLVTDVVLPGIDGRQLAQRIRSMSAGTPVLFMSGYTGGLFEDGDVESSRAFLQKPFTSAALVDRVRELMQTAC